MSFSCSDQEHGIHFRVLEAYARYGGSHVDVYWTSNDCRFQTVVSVPYDDDRVWLYDVDGCLPISADDAEQVLEQALKARRSWESHGDYCLCVECAPHLYKEAVP